MIYQARLFMYTLFLMFSLSLFSFSIACSSPLFFSFLSSAQPTGGASLLNHVEGLVGLGRGGGRYYTLSSN